MDLIMSLSQLPVRAFMFFTSMGVMLTQIQPSVPAPDYLSPYGKLALDVAAIGACGVLWRYLITLRKEHREDIKELLDVHKAAISIKESQIAKKDEIILSLTERSVMVATEAMAANKESRLASEKSMQSSEQIGDALDGISSNMAAVQMSLENLTDAVRGVPQTNLKIHTPVKPIND